MIQIIPTAEPFFFPGEGQRRRVGCLVIHGFTGTPKEMRWLGEFLNRRGYTVCGIRLAGHATRMEDMVRSRYTDWLLSVEDGYHLLRACTDQVFLLGLSMGGILALTSAAYLSVSGVVAMSTPYQMPKDTWLPLPMVRFLSRFHPYLPKEEPDSGWFDREAYRQHVAYPADPVRSGVELKLLLAEMRAALPQLTVPVLLVHSRDDRSVPPEDMPKIYTCLGTRHKEMFWLEGAGHVVTEEPPRQRLFEAIAQFIEKIVGAG